MRTDRCHDAVTKLLAKDLAGWTGLPATCTLTQLPRIEVGTVEQAVVLGDESLVATYRRAKADAYAEPIKVYLRGDTIVRISIPLPELSDPAGLLAKLGAPDAKLDAWFATTPTVHHEAEWVYAQRGLALVLSSNRQNVMELIVYPSTTAERYRKQLRYFEVPRESE